MRRYNRYFYFLGKKKQALSTCPHFPFSLTLVWSKKLFSSVSPALTLSKKPNNINSKIKKTRMLAIHGKFVLTEKGLLVEVLAFCLLTNLSICLCFFDVVCPKIRMAIFFLYIQHVRRQNKFTVAGNLSVKAEAAINCFKPLT